MNSPLQLRDVFTPGGLPSVTYVSRDELELEKKVGEGLARGFAFIVVTGPTKSGKSVLCTKVLGENLVSIEGGQIRSEADFWNQVAYKLNLASGSSESQGVASATIASGEVSGGVPLVVSGKGTLSYSGSDQKNTTQNFTSVPILASIDQLLRRKFALMVDDFHYIDSAIQKTLIQSLKGAVFKGLPVVLLAVPHRAFDPVTIENEVEGRFKHIAIPNWALDDLIKIPERGFTALNVIVDRAVQRRICEDSFGNPLLVQEICSEFCLQNGVRSSQGTERQLDPTLIEKTYRAMAESKGFPVYQKLKRGPEGHRARRLFFIRGGGEIDLNTAVLAAVARLGPKMTTSLDDTRESLRGVIADGVRLPTRRDIQRSLLRMNEAAKKMQGEPPLEWVSEDQRLEITDPFLLFCLKWSDL